MEQPFFSIITICKNSKKDIQECLSSIYSQSFKDFEHIICDGNSIDGTLNIINKIKNKNTRLFIADDQGLYDALNKGISKSIGKYIVILHSDDKFYNDDVLRNLNKEILTNSYPPIVIANIVYINAKGTILRRWKSDLPSINKIKRGWMAPHTGLVLKNEITKLLGPYNTKLKISADYEYELRLFKNHLNDVINSNIILIKMKIGGVSNRDINSFLRKTFEDFKVMRENDVNPFIGIFFKKFNKLNQFWNQF